MSYKRVVEKEGKTYGPYRYESYRDENGKVKKRYLGKIDDKKENIFSKKTKQIKDSFNGIKINKKVFSYIGFGLFLLAAVLLVSKSSITGFAVSNETSIDVSEIEASMIEEGGVATLQYKAVINKPVKWIKKTVAKKDSSIKLPKVAKDIVVLKGDEIDNALAQSADYENELDETPRESISKISPLTGNVISDLGSEGILTKLWNWLSKGSITGNVISESSLGEGVVENVASKTVNLSNVASENEEVAVEYYTEAPSANETVINNGKRVVISAPSELGYTDVLAYSVVEGMGIRMDNPNLKVYWYEDTDENVVYDESLDDIEEEVVEDIEDSENIDDEFTDNIDDIEEEVVEEVNDTEVVDDSENDTIEIENDTMENEDVVDNSSNDSDEEENTTEEELEEEIAEDLNQSTEAENEDVVQEDEEAVDSIIEEEAVDEVISDVEPNEPEGDEEVVQEEEPEEEISLSPLTGNVISAGVGEVAKESTEKNRAKLNSEVAKYLNPGVKMDRVRREVAFTPYDFDNDGYVDYIEWVVPHLSVQVYEIVYITRAEHLDENRVFVEDVFNEVENQDNVFTSPIYNDEYLRVVFEKNLNSRNDITIHARSNGTADILVYEKNGIDLIARFEDVSSKDTYKIILNGLSGAQDTFDLRIFGDPVEFDYVIDPTPITLAIPQTFNVHGKLSNATGPLNGTFEFNFSIYDVYTGGTYLWNDVMNITTDDEGVYSVALNVSGLDFSAQYYLGISVEGDPEMTPRLNLTSAPYAFMAQHVYVGGIIWDENMDASGYNITADVLIANDELNIDSGRMRWNSTNSVFEYWDGDSWEAIGSGVTDTSSLTASVETYDSGWLLNGINSGTADWTNVSLGSNNNTDSNVVHNLNASLEELDVKLFVSTDGTNANSFEVSISWAFNNAGPYQFGATAYEVDSNRIEIKTAIDGLAYILDTGTATSISTEPYYYKVVVRKFTDGAAAIEERNISRVRATLNFSQPVSSGATLVYYNITEYDTLGEWNGTRFTATEAGYYSVDAQTLSSAVSWATNSYWITQIYVNGALKSNGMGQRGYTGSYFKSSIVSDAVYLNVGDYVEIYVAQNYGATSIYDDPNYNHLSISRLDSSVMISQGGDSVWTNNSGTAEYEGDVVIKL